MNFRLLTCRYFFQNGFDRLDQRDLLVLKKLRILYQGRKK